MSAGLRSSLWQQVVPVGDMPGPRTKLSAVLWRDRMVVFGGGFRRDFCDGLFEYGFHTNLFMRVPTTDDQGGHGPTARRSHSCVVYNNKLLVFGGRVRSGRLNDLYELDLLTHRWRLLHPPAVTLQAALREGNGAVDLSGVVRSCPYLEASLAAAAAAGPQDPTPNPRPLAETVDAALRSIPCERAAHSACLYAGRYMIIFGGNSSLYDLFLDDLHSWDCERLRWARLEPTSASRPKGRLGHSTVIQGHRMFLFGGYGGEALSDLWGFDFLAAQWREIRFAFPINPSSFHAAVLYNDQMVVYGGSFGNQVNDLNPPKVYAFHTYAERWSVVEHDRSLPLPHPPARGEVRAPTGRLGHALLLHGYNLYLFAGSDQTYYNDLFATRLEPPSLRALLGAYVVLHDAELEVGREAEGSAGVTGTHAGDYDPG